MRFRFWLINNKIMRKYILSFLVSAIFYASSANCKSYDSLIVPIEINDLADEQIKQEINLIKNGQLKGSESLERYRSKYYKSTILNTYAKDSWRFYTNFSGNNIISKKGNTNVILLGANNNISRIDFYHMNYVLNFNESVLEHINNKIREEQPLVMETNAYISSDRLRNYLHIIVKERDLRKHWVFIIKNSNFLTCVFFEE